MANDSIKVSTQVLIEKANKISVINTTLDDKLAAINKAMNDLESTWISDGASAIREAMNAMKPTFEKYKEVVNSYAEFLKKTATAYETVEETIQSSATAFK